MLKLAVAVIYSIAVLSWTLYGYTKFFNENFCLQSRPGNKVFYNEHDDLHDIRFVDNMQNYDILYQYGVLNLTLFHTKSGKRSNIKLGDDVKVNKDWTLNIQKTTSKQMFYSDFEKMQYTFSSKLDGNYLKISCISTNESATKLHSGKSLYIRENGFPYLGSKTFEAGAPSFQRCWVSIFSENCETTSGVLKFFIIASFIALAMIFTITFAFMFKDETKIWLYKSYDFFNFSEIPIYFCNPLDYKYKLTEEIDFITVLCNNKCETFIKGKRSSFYKGKNYTILTNGNNLTIINNISKIIEHNESISCDKITEIEILINYLNVDNKNWIVTGENFDHYINMSEFINLCLNKNVHFCRKELKGKRYITKTSKIFLNFFTRKFKMNSDVMSIFISHNIKFFNGFIPGALMNVLQKKVSWLDRGLNVKNTQWKRYINDINILYVSKGYKPVFNHYKKPQQPTKALLDAIKQGGLNEEDILEIDGKEENYELDISDSVTKSFRLKLESLEQTEINSFKHFENEGSLSMKNSEFDPSLDVIENIKIENEKTKEKILEKEALLGKLESEIKAADEKNPGSIRSMKKSQILQNKSNLEEKIKTYESYERRLPNSRKPEKLKEKMEKMNIVKLRSRLSKYNDELIIRDSVPGERIDERLRVEIKKYRREIVNVLKIEEEARNVKTQIKTMKDHLLYIWGKESRAKALEEVKFLRSEILSDIKKQHFDTINEISFVKKVPKDFFMIGLIKPTCDNQVVHDSKQTKRKRKKHVSNLNKSNLRFPKEFCLDLKNKFDVFDNFVEAEEIPQDRVQSNPVCKFNLKRFLKTKMNKLKDIDEFQLENCLKMKTKHDDHNEVIDDTVGDLSNNQTADDTPNKTLEVDKSRNKRNKKGNFSKLKDFCFRQTKNIIRLSENKMRKDSISLLCGAFKKKQLSEYKKANSYYRESDIFSAKIDLISEKFSEMRGYLFKKMGERTAYHLEKIKSDSEIAEKKEVFQAESSRTKDDELSISVI